MIHIDEKWFYITLVDRTYYLCNDEEAPVRTVQHKSHIQKIMFLTAVARPRFAGHTCSFDGKIGIWPFLEAVAAKKASKNRPKGTLELKSVNITKPVYRDMLIGKVLPAIRERWPDGNSEELIIQQDNARPHIDPDDRHFLAEASKFGFRIRLQPQPPNSPDMNVCDLGFFHSIQSKQHENSSNSIQELRDAVIKAFWEMPPYFLLKVWISLQQCMIETLKCDGNNTYKLPHMKKDMLFKRNNLPLTLSVDRNFFEYCVATYVTTAPAQLAPVPLAPPSPLHEPVRQFLFSPLSESEGEENDGYEMFHSEGERMVVI